MQVNYESDVKDALARIRDRQVDREFLSQAQLDVVSRDRVSAFPWRGQFTPGLVDLLIASHSRTGMTVLDPFAGSGTTLAEAVRRGLAAVGVEVNPAAVELARVFTLASDSASDRRVILAEARKELASCLLQGEASLFGESPDNLLDEVLLAHKRCSTPQAANLIAVSIMLAMGDTGKIEADRLRRAVAQVSQVVQSLPDDPVSCSVHTGDARKLPLPAHSVDLIVTSPPYINVFNYHQNYRPAIERLGWQVLPSARSEIGSNRKHRQNRFFTVVQYAIDMLLALHDFARVCRVGAKTVIVVGRESRVRGISFANGDIISCLAEFVPGFSYVRWQERRFISRFGETIYEEILTFDAEATADKVIDLGLATEVGRQMLRTGLPQAESPVIRSEIEEAISYSERIAPSPELTVGRSDVLSIANSQSGLPTGNT
jgi:16S rRNA G966 N2-methylase RsmD